MAASGRQGSQVISRSENPQARSPRLHFFPQKKLAADCFTVKIKQIKQCNRQYETRVMDLLARSLARAVDLAARSYDLARPSVAPPLIYIDYSLNFTALYAPASERNTRHTFSVSSSSIVKHFFLVFSMLLLVFCYLLTLCLFDRAYN